MQDRFLFDDSNSKQRGRGCDRLGSKKDGLVLKWTWEKNGKEGKPGQCCYAEIGKGWAAVVTFWHTNYEARLEHYDHSIMHWSKDTGDGYEGEVLVTRVSAQMKAERFMIDLYKEVEELVIKKKFISAQAALRLKGIKIA